MQDLNKYSSTYKYEQIFSGLPRNFKERAIETFRYQFAENKLYRSFAKRFMESPNLVNELTEIPFLPISFFKSGEIQSGDFIPEIIFESSGTTGQSQSRHYVKDRGLYRESLVKGFEFFYGATQEYCILGLLPSYLERGGSSLILMVDELMRLSKHSENGFYLYDFEKLHRVILELEKNQQKTILIGVGFALLDFTEKYSMRLNHTIVMETGGMKGRRAEITRTELHGILKNKLGVSRIHSEYGMTELLSQAYSAGEGIYNSVPWMKMLVRDEDDPLNVRESGEGILNVIDLANRDSCAFIATDDMTKLYEDGSFEILGRMDNSDIRGCSLLFV